MEKEEALREFLKGFKIAFNTSSAYNKTHPFFLKSVSLFKEKIEQLLTQLNPVIIYFASDHLLIDGQKLQKEGVHLELTEIFHKRKIKSIMIKDGITVEDLVSFFSAISLSPRELFKRGGMAGFLETGSSQHIAVEELDYSQLLKDEDEECKDIWLYLFQNAIASGDRKKAAAVVGNFEKIIQKFKAKDILDDEATRKAVQDLLGVVKKDFSDRFDSCMKGLLKVCLKDKQVRQEYQLRQIKSYAEELGGEIIAEALWDEIVNDTQFTSLSLDLFSQLVDEKKHREIAPLIGQKAQAAVKENPKLRKRLKELFFVQEDSYIAAIYRHALASIFAEHVATAFTFEHESVPVNYRSILLNMFTQEKRPDRLEFVTACLTPAIDTAFEEQDYEFLSSALEVINRRKGEKDLEVFFSRPEMRVAQLFEQVLFGEGALADLDCFIDALQVHYSDREFCLEKMFAQKKINAYIIKFFFKFFPNDFFLFVKHIEKHQSDIEFLQQVIESLAEVNSMLSLEALKSMFSLPGSIVKLEVLRAMQGISKVDADFLFFIIKNENIALKREALRVLLQDASSKKEALRIMLTIPSPWGRKNSLIIENMIIIDELRVKDAARFIIALSKRLFFWNRSVRKKAREILERWHAR